MSAEQRNPAADIRAEGVTDGLIKNEQLPVTYALSHWLIFQSYRQFLDSGGTFFLFYVGIFAKQLTCFK